MSPIGPRGSVGGRRSARRGASRAARRARGHARRGGRRLAARAPPGGRPSRFRRPPASPPARCRGRPGFVCRCPARGRRRAAAAAGAAAGAVRAALPPPPPPLHLALTRGRGGMATPAALLFLAPLSPFGGGGGARVNGGRRPPPPPHGGAPPGRGGAPRPAATAAAAAAAAAAVTAAATTADGATPAPAAVYRLALPLVGAPAASPPLHAAVLVARPAATAAAAAAAGGAVDRRPPPVAVTAYDFLPRSPTDPRTAAALLAGRPVAAAVRSRGWGVVPPRGSGGRCRYVGDTTMGCIPLAVVRWVTEGLLRMPWMCHARLILTVLPGLAVRPGRRCFSLVPCAWDGAAGEQER
ncbi:hypothetical protein BU14_0052s0065 [Porphyra umbilicalis]|uniref:Uncharacterized protein n=1 Tax=Porphyra umbilicalis TaxID=2786 RepID=A0A1X6PHU9_PORUM|nr:hypothetical protein BU14_0052s0065 [Porphyra umbilicalis]|eukprot:OSX80450.1 hypothetical protein BU14_0052s0065 [Porphyra umbilicalis]